jgi:hypothetical protein
MFQLSQKEADEFSRSQFVTFNNVIDSLFLTITANQVCNILELSNHYK